MLYGAALVWVQPFEVGKGHWGCIVGGRTTIQPRFAFCSQMLCSFDFGFGTGMALERALGVLEGGMLT